MAWLLLLTQLTISATTKSVAAPQPAVNRQVTPDQPKAPPPPLFPAHRRGLYTNAAGVEVVDATPQSPPLDTDDPAVPAKGEYEINFTTDAEYTRTAQRVDLLLIDVNYGVLPTVAGYKLPMQIKFELPTTAGRETGGSYSVGLGTASCGLKFKFYHDEQHGISVAVYPQLEFPTSKGGTVTSGSVEKGQTLLLPLLVAREFHELVLVFNGAVEKPLHDPDRQSAAEFGAGVGRAFTRKVAGMIELRTESSLNFQVDRLVVVNGGVIHGVRRIVWYAKAGHSLFADDHIGHAYAGLGIKVQIETTKKP